MAAEPAPMAVSPRGIGAMGASERASGAEPVSLVTRRA
jgi:hypothetical protein